LLPSTFTPVDSNVATGYVAVSNQAGFFSSLLASLLPASMLSSWIVSAAWAADGFAVSKSSVASNLPNVPYTREENCLYVKEIVLAVSLTCVYSTAWTQGNAPNARAATSTAQVGNRCFMGFSGWVPVMS
jgi:acyl-homoserine lactone acylase PvdQ